jgi:GntR family transcriptional regulator
MTRGTVDDVVRALRDAVLSGTYRRGEGLPGVREIANRLGVNKNTVSKAFGVLEREGVIEVRPGRRATARLAGRARRGADTVRARLAEALSPILREAGLLGLEEREVLEAVTAEVSAFFGARTRSITLVECNVIDARQYADELARLIGRPVRWRLIDALPPPRPDDVVVVPYYHLDDLSGRQGKGQLVGIHVAPDPDALREVLQAAQRPGQRVGLICGNPNSAQRFSRLFEFYTTRTIHISHFRDRAATGRLLNDCRVVFVTPEARAGLRSLTRRRDLVDFPEHIDVQSLGALRLTLGQALTP